MWAVLLPYALFSPSHKPFPPAARSEARFYWAFGGKTLARSAANPYIRGMRKWAIILPLLAFLAASVWFAYYVWTSDAGPPMPASGYTAMALGVLFSLVVGFGLMALVFYSHRHGYDERGQSGQQGDGKG
jgi:hypothetical protein